MTHVGQSQPDSGLDLQVTMRKPSHVVPSSLGAGSRSGGWGLGLGGGEWGVGGGGWGGGVGSGGGGYRTPSNAFNVTRSGCMFESRSSCTEEQRCKPYIA